MDRRNLLATTFGLISSLWARTSSAGDQDPAANGDQIEKQVVQPGPSDTVERPVFDMSKFPFPFVETKGENALSVYEAKKKTGEGIPVILGTPEDITSFVELWESEKPPDAATILKKADDFGPDFDIISYRSNERAKLVADLKAKGEYEDGEDWGEEIQPESSEWPTKPDVMGLTVTSDIISGTPLPLVVVATFPAKANSDIPAYVSWGNWNANPPAEVHVAMLRKWYKQYGAELVGMSGDVMNIRVKRRPTSKEEAMKLATEQFRYCEDIVLQGTESLEVLAGSLMVSDCWYFWWD